MPLWETISTQNPGLTKALQIIVKNGIYGLARPPALKRAIEIQEKETGQEVYLWWDSEEDVSEMLTEKPSKINKPYEAYSSDDDYEYDMAVYEQGAQFFSSSCAEPWGTTGSLL